MSKQQRKTAAEKEAILQGAESSGIVETIRKHGISYQTHYNRKARQRSAGMDTLQNALVISTTPQ